MPNIVLRLCAGQRRNIAGVISLIVFSGAVETAAVIGVAPIIELLTKPRMENTSKLTTFAFEAMQSIGIPIRLSYVILLFVFILIVKGCVVSFCSYLINRLQFNMITAINMNVYETVIQARFPFFVNADQGELGNSLLRETQRVWVSIEIAASIISCFVRMLFYIGIAVYVSINVTLIIVCCLGVVLIPYLLLGRLTYRLGKTHTSAGNEFQQVVTETFSAAKLVLGFGNSAEARSLLQRRMAPMIRSAVNLCFLRVLSVQTFEVIAFALTLSAVYFGNRWFHHGFAELAVLLYALRCVGNTAIGIANSRNELLNNLPGLEQVDRLMSKAHALRENTTGIEIPTIKNDLTLSGVTFAYNTEAPPAIDDISLDIPHGSLVAFVGRSGAGKTTLIDLIMGFYHPDSGSICVGNTPLTKVNLISWRKRLGYVPQDPFLFATTIRENLEWAVGRPASDEELQEACQKANAMEFIDNLPLGFETMVGDRGVRLSGGQRQRLALARALLRKPDLMILDEATSALDSHSEHLIQKSIDDIAGSMTIITIAHRLSTIRRSDCIYVIDHGRIAEQGSFDQLIAHGGMFCSTAELQGLAGEQLEIIGDDIETTKLHTQAENQKCPNA